MWGFGIGRSSGEMLGIFIGLGWLMAEYCRVKSHGGIFVGCGIGQSPSEMFSSPLEYSLVWLSIGRPLEMLATGRAALSLH